MAQFVPLRTYREYPQSEMIERAHAFNTDIQRRRTVREFSDRPVPREIIEQCLLAAGSAPSGAALQPWHFVVVSDPKVKATLRVEAEKEERDFYNGRAPQEWLDALAPLGTDENKPFLEVAPWLIAIFEKTHSLLDDGRRVKNYYVGQSTGIACGMLITALHHAGLATLTHTPSPMAFMNKILDRPKGERPFLLLVVGYPAPGVQVPDIHRKPLDRIATFI
ncbi:MAG: nitroreductase family protein [Burkholderiales bacterium]|nr:nitroreductase family protein [Burkholderiales bacterium]